MIQIEWDCMKIVVLEANALHLGYLGCYGNDWVATPNLDRLASEGAVFDAHIADQPDLSLETPWADRSVATGSYAWRKSRPEPVLVPTLSTHAALTTFAEHVLTQLQGDADFLWVQGPSLLPPWKLPRDLLTVYFEDETAAEPWTNPPVIEAEVDLDDWQHLQNTYAAVATCFDAQLGRILDGIAGVANDVLLCVTARSGLPLGEHRMIGLPRAMLHEELVHVPLLMRWPGRIDACMRVGSLTQPLDLLPTFAAILEKPIAAADGHSLWPLLTGEANHVRKRAFASLRIRDAEEWLLRSEEEAFLLPADAAKPAQWYAKPDDRWEVNDLAHQQPGRVEELERTLRAMMANEPDGAIVMEDIANDPIS